MYRVSKPHFLFLKWTLFAVQKAMKCTWMHSIIWWVPVALRGVLGHISGCKSSKGSYQLCHLRFKCLFFFTKTFDLFPFFLTVDDFFLSLPLVAFTLHTDRLNTCVCNYTLTKYRITFLTLTHVLDGFSCYLNINTKKNQNIMFLWRGKKLVYCNYEV